MRVSLTSTGNFRSDGRSDRISTGVRTRHRLRNTGPATSTENMSPMKKIIPFLLTFALSLAPLRAHDAANDMSAAASNFLAALSADQKTKATFGFADAERTDWHFIPRE